MFNNTELELYLLNVLKFPLVVDCFLKITKQLIFKEIKQKHPFLFIKIF